MALAADSPAATGAATAQGASVSIAGAKTQKIRYGASIAIGGRVNPAAGGRAVRLEHAVQGGGFRQVAVTRTAADGTYRFRVKPGRSGSFRAVAEGVATSAPRRVTVVASVSGKSRRHLLGARRISVRGRLLPALPGRRIALQLRTRGGWRTVDVTRTRSGGRFKARWRPAGAGTYRLRVKFAGDRLAAPAKRSLKKVHVYRPGHASWYGPGLYGNRLGCGGTLTPGKLGVAHKRLPCGTRVTFRFHGRSVTVPVVDRGPYVGGREWDLTAATKARLGFGSTGTVWSTK